MTCNAGVAAYFDADLANLLVTSGRNNLSADAQGTAWRCDWFCPGWMGSGNNVVVTARCFGLLSQYYPTQSENYGRNLCLGWTERRWPRAWLLSWMVRRYLLAAAAN